MSFDVLGTELGLPQLVRDVALVGVTWLSLWLTTASVRASNQFSWAPMLEVAKLFIGIFVTMVPVLAMLKAGEAGAFAAVTRAVTGPDGQPQPMDVTLREVLDQATLADEIGIDFIGLGEHHRADFAISAPEIVLGAIGGIAHDTIDEIITATPADQDILATPTRKVVAGGAAGKPVVAIATKDVFNA